MNEIISRLEAIFNTAKELQTAEQRDVYLRDACKDDPELRSQVAALLRASQQSVDVFKTKPAHEETLVAHDIAEGPGSAIGRYKLLQKIGEGGMGVVFMAEQTEPVRRKVALKIIKLGMDTKSVVARFEAERQALALMDHPNIAKVLDAGSTETGRPYFVMELVKGVPINEYCDKNRLPTKDRLRLFSQSCRAIQHAHQKGVIHRDIKPSNILVTLHDGKPVPKVIDFGIAKATNQRLTEKTLFTNFAQMIGTPAYMSPEQAEMSGLDIDTRTDVYSLGVLLYELLTGTTPFPEKELLSKGYGEMQRVIAEQLPQRPSLRLSTLLGEQQSVVTKNRDGELSILTKQLRGDLDWIIMKALEKDRTRRYDTANGFAEDIERHLDGEPVLAAKPTLGYQLAKLYHRHKPAVAAAAGITLALAIGSVVATASAIDANDAKNKANDAKTLAEEATENERMLREDAERLTEIQRVSLYASDMKIANDAIKANDFTTARNILIDHKPTDSSANDLRGFEWRYLWKTSRERSLASANVAHFAHYHHRILLSPDKKQLVLSADQDDRANLKILRYPDLEIVRSVDLSFDYEYLTPPPKMRFSPDSAKLYVLTPGEARLLPESERPETNYFNTVPIETRQWALRIYNTQTWELETEVENAYAPLLIGPNGDPIVQSFESHDTLGQLSPKGELYSVTTADNGRYVKTPLGIPHQLEKIHSALQPSKKRSVVALASEDETHLTLWDTKNNKLLPTTLPFHTQQKDDDESLFSPDGTLFVSTTIPNATPMNGSIRLFKTSSGQEILLDRPAPRILGRLKRFAFTEDSQRLVAADDLGATHVWNTKNGAHLGTIGDQRYEIRQMIPENNRIICMRSDGQIVVLDTHAINDPASEFAEMPTTTQAITPIPSPYDYQEGMGLQIDEGGATPELLQFINPNVLDLLENDIVEWELPSDLQFGFQGADNILKTENSISPDGRYLGVLHVTWNDFKFEYMNFEVTETLYRFYDLQNNDELVAEWTSLPFNVIDGAGLRMPRGFPNFINDHQLLADFGDYFELWDLQKRERKRLDIDARLACSNEPFAVFSQASAVMDAHKNRLLIGASQKGLDSVVVWDLDRNEQTSVLGPYVEHIRQIRLSPDGTQALVTGNEADVLLIDAHDGRIIKRLAGHRPNTQIDFPLSAFITADFAPDGRTVMTTDAQNALRFWNVETGREMIRLQLPIIPTAAYGGYHFTKDGNGAYTWRASQDPQKRTLSLLTLPTLKEIDAEIEKTFALDNSMDRPTP